MSAPTVPPPASGDAAAPARRRVPRQLSGLLGRWRARVRPQSDGPRPAWLLGIAAALWSAAIGLAIAVIPMLLTWMTSTGSGLTWTDAVRLGGLIWVAANGAAVTIGGLTITLLPWGLAVVPLLLLGYAGSWSARRGRVQDGRGVLGLVVAGSVAYALIGGVVAIATARTGASVSVSMALLGCLLIAGLALTWGAMRAAGLGLLARLPLLVTVSLRAGLAAAVTLVGLGALAATVSLLLHMDDAITMAQSLGAGVGGGLALVVLGMAYVPNMAMWGAAYVMGAGVVIGPGVTLTPFIASAMPTQLPPFPLLAALPQSASALAWVLPLTGVLAGAVAGLLIARKARSEPRLVRLALAAGAALVAGLVLALGALLASGSLGDLRLAHLGPVPMTVGVLGAVLVLLGAVPSAVAPAPPPRPVLAIAEDDPTIDATDSVDSDVT